MWMGGQNVSQGSWWPKAGERYQQQVGHVQDLGLFKQVTVMLTNMTRLFLTNKLLVGWNYWSTMTIFLTWMFGKLMAPTC